MNNLNNLYKLSQNLININGTKPNITSSILSIVCKTNESVQCFRAHLAQIIAIKIDKFCDVNKFEDIILTIGSIDVLNIRFNLLYKLSKKECIDNCYYITFPENYLFLNGEHLPISCTTYNNKYFKITGENDIQYELYIKESLFVDKIARTDFIFPINLYVYDISRTLKKNKVDNRTKYFTGFFIETTKIKEISIEYQGFCLLKYDSYMLSSRILHKDIWNRKKSKIFNIIMDKILPPEMIRHIESYINNTYLYYVPIDINNNKWNEVNNYIANRNDITINFDKVYYGEINYVSQNQYLVMSGCGGIKW